MQEHMFLQRIHHFPAHRALPSLQLPDSLTAVLAVGRAFAMSRERRFGLECPQALITLEHDADDAGLSVLT